MEDTIDLKDMLGALWRRKLIIAAAIVAVTAGSVGYSLQQPKVYAASSTVVIRPIIPAVAFSSGIGSAKGGPLGLDVSADSHAEILTSAVIGERVRKALKSPIDARVLAGAVSAEVLTDELIQVSASALTPALAAQLADAFPSEYLAYRDEQATTLIAVTAADLQRRIDDADTRIATLDRRVSKAKGTQQERLIAERNDAIRQQGATQSRLDELRSGEQTSSGGEVIQPAAVPTGASSPNPKRDGAVGFILGALLGIGLAMLRNNFDDRIRSSAQASVVSAAPVIGIIPRAKAWKRKKDAVPIMLLDPSSRTAEAYRGLRQTLINSGLGRDMKTIALTSGARGAGKSTTVANLAIASAQAGFKVIAVSADFRTTRLGDFFAMSEDVGLAQALEGAEVGELLQATSVPGLSILPSGSSGTSAAALLDSPRLDLVLTTIGELADVVILDLPAMSTGADARLLAARSDATIVVLRNDMARESGTREAVVALRLSGAQRLSLVLNVSSDRPETDARVDLEQPPFAYVPREADHGTATGAGDTRRPVRRGAARTTAAPPNAASTPKSRPKAVARKPSVVGRTISSATADETPTQ